MNNHKYKYGIIGNGAYSALVDDKANIGWMCLPKFDSSCIFGSLLDEEKGGRFSIQPEWDSFTSSQKYIQNTNIIETIFECEDGIYKVIDFAPRFRQYERFYKPLMLVRKIIPIKGRPRIRVSCKPVGNYGEIVTKKVFGSSHIRFEGLESQVRLTTNIPLSYVDQEMPFVLNSEKYLVLTWGAPLEAPLESSAENYLQQTIRYWHQWVKNTTTESFHQEAIIRSALTLKLHQYQDTGAIVTATTTSLPEFPGSGRNWDYRYCWIRDAHFTIKALNDLSHFSILEDYVNFIENIALNDDNRFNQFYPVALDKFQKEKIVPLKGYLGNRPVRVGNDTFNKKQNHVYGQILVTLLPFFDDKRFTINDDSTLKIMAENCLDIIEEIFNEKDTGLWDSLGTEQYYCYTFLSHWVGCNAAYKIAKSIQNEKMMLKAKNLIAQAKVKIESCYNEENESYTSAIGIQQSDASLFQLINFGYLDPKSEKARQLVEKLENDLLSEKTELIYSYRHQDDFGAPESTKLICTFWYIQALATIGEHEKASKIFDNTLKFANHLGLLSETVHDNTGGQWGNFPHTYSHVGLINAAMCIARKINKPNYLID